jgi:hypothetical protein
MAHTYKIMSLRRLAPDELAPRTANFQVEIDLGVGRPVRKYFAHLNVERGKTNDVVLIRSAQSELLIPDDEVNPTGPCGSISVEGGRTKILNSGYSGIEIKLAEALPLHHVNGADDSAPGALRGWTRVEHKSRDDR